MTVLRVRSGRRKGASKPIRALNEIQLSRRMWKAGRSLWKDRPCERIVFYSPTIFFGRLVHRLKQRWGATAYLVLRDIFPQWAVDAGILRDGLICRYFRGKERYQYRQADVIGVQLPGDLEYFKRNGLAETLTLEVLYNWTDPTVPPQTTDLRSRLGLGDKTVFFYGGNIGQAQDMDNLLRLARRLKDRDDAHFLLLGEGTETARLQNRIQRDGLTNVTLHPTVPQEQYRSAVGEFDIGLISLAGSLKTNNFPGKTLDYMLHGMAILASINPGNDLEPILTSAGAGRVCHNGQDDALYRAAVDLLDDPVLRESLGRKARGLLVDQFSVSRAAEQILTSLERVN
jgi:glycosyltransferase involved in cell wall biosynthesis